MKKIVIPFLLSALLINSAWAVDFSELEFKRQNRERIAVLKKDGQPYTGIATSFFDNGQKEYESYYWQGKKHGPSYTWVKTGELKQETHWLHNQKQGYDITWEKERGNDGKNKRFNKTKQKNYVNGLHSGLEKRWYNGYKTYTAEYVHDEKNGLATTWAGGQLKNQYHYIDGDINGLARRFYKDGSLEEESVKNAKGLDSIRMLWAKNGVMIRSNFATDGKYDGVSSEYYDNGILSTEKFYRNGKKIGNQSDNFKSGTPALLWAAKTGKRIKYYKNTNQRVYEYYYLENYREKNQYNWHENGQVERVSKYDFDKLKGLVTNWYANGFKESEAFYEGYDVNGNQKVWYGNGQLKSDTNYVDGEIEGASFVWYRNGQLKSKTDYKLIKGSWNSYGKKHGDALEWYADGKKKVEARYRNGELTGIRRTWRDDGSLYSERDMSATEQ